MEFPWRILSASKFAKEMLCCLKGQHIKKQYSRATEEDHTILNTKSAVVKSVPSKEHTNQSYSCVSVDTCGQISSEGERRPAPLYTRVLVRKGCVTVHLEGLQVTIKKQQALICSLPGSSSLQQAVAPNPEDPAVKDLVSRLKIGAFVEGKEDFIDKSLPFHLVVLEWALQTATQSVTAEAIRLESQVDAITQKIIKQVTRALLQELRLLKLQIRSLQGRVRRLSEELNSLLDNNSALSVLCLFQASDEAKAAVIESRPKRKSRQLHGVLPPENEDIMREVVSLVECYLMQLTGVVGKLQSNSSATDHTSKYLQTRKKAQHLVWGFT